MTLFHLGVFATSLLSSFILTRFVRNLAKAHGWVAAPASDRHVHTEPLPRLGGVAIFLSFFLSIAWAMLVTSRHPETFISWGRMGTILLAGSLVFLLGVYDDLRPVGPYAKFGVQIIAGSILFANGLRILDLPVLFGGHCHAESYCRGAVIEQALGLDQEPQTPVHLGLAKHGQHGDGIGRGD